MGIKSIEIEGFGPFIQRQRIPIAPLTMIFGPNSTGKTSLFRAIHHAQHCILKDEIAGRESSLCPGFDLLEPKERANDSQEPYRDPSKVRFISESMKFDKFVLPGGCTKAAMFHHARTVCRRAERSAVALNHQEEIPELVLPYINRLSDLLFMLARLANKRLAIPDREW